MRHDDQDEERRRFEILGDFETDARDLFELLRERIRQGLGVRHVEKTEHGWQLTQALRLSGVIEWDPETEGARPLLIVDGRTFTWDQVGHMLARVFVSASRSKGWRKLTVRPPPFHGQFQTTKFSNRRFSRGSCLSNNLWAFFASSRILTPSSR